MIAHGDRIEVIPVRPLRTMRRTSREPTRPWNARLTEYELGRLVRLARALRRRPECQALCPTASRPDELIVPTLCLYEVYKVVLRQRGPSAALQAVALMRQGRIVELGERIALLAAELGLKHKLPMADSVILATARVHDAHVWTQDADFAGIENVTLVPESRPKASR